MTDYTPKYFRIDDTDEDSPEDTYIQEAFSAPEVDHDTQEAVQIPCKPVIDEGEAVIDGERFEYRPIAETVVIDGKVFDSVSVESHDYHGIKSVSQGQTEFYLAESAEEAGQAAQQYWADMAEVDPEEFTCMVGEDTLVQWALGQYAGPGSTKVRSLSEWLDLHLDIPEENLASYDGEEKTVDFCSEDIEDELGYTPAVAYRSN